MKTLLLTCLFLISAGGVPLASTDILTEQQKLLIESQKDLLKRQRDWQKTMEKVIPVTNEPYDPEYIAILEDYDRRKEAFELSHRDLQWHITAKVMRDIDDVNERLGLIETVRNNPLWRSLPPTVAITSVNLSNWNTARTMFYEHLKRVRK